MKTQGTPRTAEQAYIPYQSRPILIAPSPENTNRPSSDYDTTREGRTTRQQSSDREPPSLRFATASRFPTTSTQRRHTRATVAQATQPLNLPKFYKKKKKKSPVYICGQSFLSHFSTKYRKRNVKKVVYRPGRYFAATPPAEAPCRGRKEAQERGIARAPGIPSFRPGGCTTSSCSALPSRSGNNNKNNNNSATREGTRHEPSSTAAQQKAY